MDVGKDTVPEKAAEQTNLPEKLNRLEKLEQRIAQLEKRKKALQERDNEKKRKARTRRLVQIGAIAIKYLNLPNDIEPAEFEERIKVLADEIIARKM